MSVYSYRASKAEELQHNYIAIPVPARDEIKVTHTQAVEWWYHNINEYGVTPELMWQTTQGAFKVLELIEELNKLA